MVSYAIPYEKAVSDHRWLGYQRRDDLYRRMILQLPPKTLTPSQNASKSVQIADRSASQQNMYEEDDLRLPPSTGSIIVATAVLALGRQYTLSTRRLRRHSGEQIARIA